MARHTLAMDWWPALSNRLLRTHWATRSRLLRCGAEALALDALSQGVPKATGKRRVSLTVLYNNESHRPDPDAFWKVTLDCLARAHLLLDDNPDACELGSVTYERAPRKGLIITLEDVP
jgi:hypothetical protein